MSTTRGWLAWVIAVGCAMQAYPAGSQAEQEFVVNSLHCRGPGPLVAAGHVVGADTREGALFVSEDRGMTWRRSDVAPAAGDVPLMLWAWRVGDEARLYATPFRSPQSRLSQLAGEEPSGPWWTTADGGRTWARGGPGLPALLAKGYTFSRVFVADTKGSVLAVGYKLGSPALLRSTDGGANWDAKSFPGLDYIHLATDGAGHVVLFGGETPALFGGPGKRLYLSADSGATLNEVPADALSSNSWLYWSPNGTLLAASLVQRSGGLTVVMHSKDHGRTWSASVGAGNAGQVAGLAGDASGRVVAVTEYGYILLSDDGGASWRQAGRPTTAGTRLPFYPLMLAQDGRVAILLAKGIVLRSTNRGDSWTVVETGKALLALVPPGTQCDDGEGLIVVADKEGAVYRSDDWGATWQPGRLAR